jgi:hypothetical protein
MAKITDPDLLNDNSVDNNTTEVFIDTTAKTVKLTEIGNLSSDGLTIKSLYSFLKEEWRVDPQTKNLAAFDFPMNPITDEFFEFVGGWSLLNSAAIQLVRDGGFLVRNTSGNLTSHFTGIKTIGTVETNDQVYFNQGNGADDFVYLGPVNEVVQIISDPNGDGAYGDGYDRSTTFQIFLREQGQVYSQSSIDAIGATDLLAPKVFAFALNTSTDLKIDETDATITGSTPYNQINIKYFDQAYTRDVDSSTDRNFGIVIDVGTHSGVDGSASINGRTLTTAEAGITGLLYTGGTLTIHEGANAGIYTISGTPTSNIITITTAFISANTNQSFTLQRATGVIATAEQIYEKVQYQLRLNADIDATDQSVIGKTADELLNFVGDTLVCGSSIPTNPNGGGSGVIIEGFQSSDTNRIQFYDNSGITRTYPFVAVLTLNFGSNLVSDASAKYWVYFTTLPGAGNDFNEAGALLVDDNAGADITGNISGQATIEHTFNYDGNVQGGRTPATDAAITVVGIGLSTGQYVKATGTIGRSTTNSISLVAALERNYQNV